MADADAAVPSPQPPPPGWRTIAAALVPSRYALAAAAAAAVIYLVLGMDWVLFASLGARRAACAAESCAAVAAADGVSSFAMVSLVVLGLVAIAAAVCSIFVSGNTEEENAPPTDDLILPLAEQPVLLVLQLGMLALMGFVSVTVFGFMLKTFSPFRGSQMERFGSLIIDVGVLCIVLLNCFIVLPSLALFVWKKMLVIWHRI